MITVEFKDFNDMMKFAGQLLNLGMGGGGQEKAAVCEIQPQVMSLAEQAADTAGMQNPVAQPAHVVTPATTTPASIGVPRPAPVNAMAAQVPTTPASYAIDDLANAARVLMDSGRQGELLNLLAGFGVESLPALPKEQYGAFATALRGMGAPI